MRTHLSRRRFLFDFAIILAIATLALIVIEVSVARGAEIVPSLGITRPVDGGDAHLYTGLAIRGDVAPLLEGELGVAYRSESRFDDQLRVRSWPITASLYLRPVTALYAGAGVGWYQTTFAYADGVPLGDETKQDFGVHVGGGIELPLGPGAGLDLNGRYVMMRDQQSRLVPEKFNPDFWTTSLGLAVRF
jgi:hypothetical protein